MKEIKAYGKIENGAFYPRNSRVYMQKMKDAGNVHDCLLTITGTNRRTVDQNSFAWLVFDRIAMAMQDNGYSEVTAGMLYRQAEEKYCMTTVQNEHTGKTIEYIKPLKEQPPERFWEIIEEIRISFNENPAFDMHIETPAKHYGITEEAYDLMKSGVIDYFEAKK